MTRSWWGRGDVDQALTDTEAAALVERVGAPAPGHDFTDHGPPDSRSLGVAPARLTAPATLAALCSDDVVDRLGHARGKAYRDVVRNLEGRVDHVPDLIARPRTEQDVVDLLDWCAGAGTAVVPYGGGSSVPPAASGAVRRIPRRRQGDAGPGRSAQSGGARLNPRLGCARDSAAPEISVAAARRAG